MDIKQRMTH